MQESQNNKVSIRMFIYNNFKTLFQRSGLTLMFALAGNLIMASEDIADQYPQSVLYQKPVEVIPGVFSAIGNRTTHI